MNLRTRVPAAVTAALSIVALAVAPAAAVRAAYDDPADASASLSDIRHVSVKHGPTRVKLHVRFTELRRTSDGGPASLAILLDTRTDRTGPEFRLVSGLQEGMDYQLVRMKHGKPVGEPLTCAHDVRLDFAANVLAFTVDRTCLDDPGRVRIGVRMRDEYDGSHPVTDWLGAPRSYTGWLASD
ncbi:hypothetical protein ABLE68_20850 [Nocardioides sp. CN2-186]|uniref:hypothetical protein n=1 Tax=Nocardioides tweenelious TaxID=3156607 RepID=UPI0032B38802